MNKEIQEEAVPEYLEQLKAECAKLNLATTEEIDCFFNRVKIDSLNNFTSQDAPAAVKLALQAQYHDYVFGALDNTSLILAAPSYLDISDYNAKLLAFFADSAFTPAVTPWTKLTEAVNEEEFDTKPVWIAKFVFANAEDAAKAQEAAKLLFWTPVNDIFEQYLIKPGLVTRAEANLLRAAAEFMHTQFSFIDRSAYSKSDIFKYIALNIDTVKLLVEYFQSKFTPGNTYCEECGQAILAKAAEAIDTLNSGVYYNDVIAKNILKAFANFVSSIAKTNFYSPDKAALSFRLLPTFMDFYGNINAAYNASFPADRPHGVFYFYRENAVGFQVRFAEIARGGWRTVVPKRNANALDEMALFDAANDEIFREGFVLAHTQHLKNKDIYEGGSKMIMLFNLEPNAPFKPALWTVQRAVCEAFVSLINYDSDNTLRDKNIVDYLKRKEIIEIGPDENMFDDMIVWMGKYAEKAGYTLKAGLISGKPDSGINHKEYGVTSFGVYQYLLRTMKELNIDPASEFSVKIAGGPGGDVAGNMMKLLLAKKDDGTPVHPQLKIVAITDGPAVIFDPAGIDREELGKLVLKANLDGFDPAKLTGDGAYMLFSKPVDNLYRLVEVKGGKNCERMVDRNEYMSIFQNNLYNYADIFMPCGGRPSTLNINNYLDYMPNGKASSRAIVEGGNSFITPEARIKLQDAGIPIVKDASANKCGVITSSYEILSGLLLDLEEFQADKEEIVKEVLAKLAKLAQGEAEWLFATHKATGKYLTDLTEELSGAINRKNVEIAEYFSVYPEELKDEIILAHLPKILAEKYADRISRLPAEYRVVIASVELATRIVYNQNGTLKNEITTAMMSL